MGLTVPRDLLERLPASLMERVETIARTSRDLGVPTYLVGGFVRDLLLGRETRDLDVVVVGDGIELAARLAEAVGGRIRAHRAFLTAVVIDPEGDSIDIATARSELYRAPAALPEVRAADLQQDLFRRDFTVNTLAIRLGPEPGFDLVDILGGRRDIEAKTLRVLHGQSFVDDPTRILRAVRLELRLGFRMSPETLDLVAAAVAEGVFDLLSGSRLLAELALLLDDSALALPGIERLAELGVLRGIDPRLELDAGTRRRLREVHALPEGYRVEAAAWRLFLMALMAGLGEADRERLAGRLLLAGEDRRLLLGFPARLDAARAVLHSEPKPHQAAEVLERLAGEELLLLVAEGDERVRGWVRRYLAELRPLALDLRGADLLAAGVPAGARVGEALRATRRARLDGRIDAAGELRYALAFVEGDS
jgi:tRNA nucleotidyltransferase (CCA-adding enzyme)